MEKHIDAESFITYINNQFFFKEFTYSFNKFKDINKQEKQVTDCLLWLDDIMILFQVKERMLYDIKFENPVDSKRAVGILYIYGDAEQKKSYYLITFDGKYIEDKNLNDLRLGKEIKEKIQEYKPVFSKEEKNSILRAISKKHHLPKMTFAEESCESARKWFNRSVESAKKQIESDISYFEENKIISLRNNKGHIFNVNLDKKIVYKIIIYSTKYLLPPDCHHKKFCLNTKKESIHVFSRDNYELIVNVLITPAEIIDYLCFREHLIRQHREMLWEIKEISILGQYISGYHENRPSNNFEQVVRSLIYRADISSISFLMRIFHDKMIYSSNLIKNESYYVTKELAKLTRDEIYAFSEKFYFAISSAQKKETPIPRRFSIPRLNCGFVFIATLEERNNQDILRIYTELQKYDSKSQKCIGFAVYVEKDGSFIFIWSYLDEQWQEDKEMSDFIKNNSPFIGEAQLHHLTRYHFRQIE